jgi:hypothetical protein
MRGGGGKPRTNRLTPCNLIKAVDDRRTGAVADEGPRPLRDNKPVGERGSSSAVPIELGQSLGPQGEPVCARMGSDGRGHCRNRRRQGQVGCGGSAEQQRKKHRPNPRMLASIERLLAAVQRELSDLDGQTREAIKARPPGARRTSFSKACRAWGRRSPADCWPRRRSSARSTAARSPRSGAGAVDAPVGPMEGQELHRRRTRPCAQRPLHGSSGGGQA